MGSKRFDDVRDFHRHGESIALFCQRCLRYAEVDTGPLVLRPNTINRHPATLPWRCGRCGAAGKDILVGYDARMQRHRAVP